MSPRRAARTHSKGKPLTFQTICEEALGALGIHPWDLWQYTFEEYLWRRTGYYAEQRRILNQHWQHTRIQTYYGIAYNPDLSITVRKRKMDKLIPDIYDESVHVEKDREYYQKMREHAKQVTANLRKRAGLQKKKGNGQ